MGKEHDKLFIPPVWSYVQSYNNATQDAVKKKLKEGLKDTLRKWTDQPVKMVSKEVLDRAKSNLPRIDPFKLLWPQRQDLGMVEEDGKRPKSWLVWEHTTPLDEFYKTLIECQDEIQIREAMNNYSGVCWISREEDNRLNRNNYQSKRPGAWKKCYEECKIGIITVPNKT